MSEIPGDLKYLRSHEWARMEDDGNVRVGISDHAQSQLGDLVFVELPEVGDMVEQEVACAVIESVKAAREHLEVVAVYRRNGLETDLAVHIHSHGEPDAAGQSDLGLRLASALRVHGLVEHTVWEEIE